MAFRRTNKVGKFEVKKVKNKGAVSKKCRSGRDLSTLALFVQLTRREKERKFFTCLSRMASLLDSMCAPFNCFKLQWKLHWSFINHLPDNQFPVRTFWPYHNKPHVNTHVCLQAQTYKPANINCQNGLIWMTISVSVPRSITNTTYHVCVFAGWFVVRRSLVEKCPQNDRRVVESVVDHFFQALQWRRTSSQ